MVLDFVTSLPVTQIFGMAIPGKIGESIEKKMKMFPFGTYSSLIGLFLSSASFIFIFSLLWIQWTTFTIPFAQFLWDSLVKYVFAPIAEIYNNIIFVINKLYTGYLYLVVTIFAIYSDLLFVFCFFIDMINQAVEFYNFLIGWVSSKISAFFRMIGDAYNWLWGKIGSTMQLIWDNSFGFVLNKAVEYALWPINKLCDLIDDILP